MTGGRPAGSSMRNASAARSLHHDLDAERLGARTRGQDRGRRLDAKPWGGDIELPSDKHHRVAVPHEQPITDAAVAGVAPVERAQEIHHAAIRDLEQQDAVAFCRIGRAKHVQVGREAHPPIGITSRMIEVDDADVVRIGRIQRELDAADKPLVRPRGSEGLPACHDAFER